MSSADGNKVPTVSVIIPNYNYANFLGEAIRSAIDLDWPAVEIIVADDGSTDDSQAVIESFGERVKAIYLNENHGQYFAYNVGFDACCGDMIIFLDADDVLKPDLINEAFAVWKPDISKVQVQMATIDANGEAIGAVFPQFDVPPSASDIRRWALTTASYPTPPGSGNVYSRQYIEQIFPLDISCGQAGDSCCLAAAPFLGDVITVAKPLVLYRVHGRNHGAVSQLMPERFVDNVERAFRRFRYGLTFARRAGLATSDQAIHRSLSLLPYRLAAFRLSDRAPADCRDNAVSLTALTFRAVFTPQGHSVQARAALAVWSILVAWLPLGLARHLILWRFAPTRRPRVLSGILRRLAVLRTVAS